MVTLHDVVAWIEETTQAIPGSLDPCGPLVGFDGWDSMGMVVFLELVEERTGAELAVYELRSCESCAQVLELIERTLAS